MLGRQPKHGVTEALLTARTADTPTLLHIARATFGAEHAGVAATGRNLHALPTDNSSRFLGLSPGPKSWLQSRDRPIVELLVLLD